MNRLHLHLTDDQGWRIEIKSWPKLAEFGGKTQVGGKSGGYYTQEQYKEIVEYARSRYVMIIPEIDTPGHTNAALASYPELNQSEEAPNLYEGTEVGFSTLWIDSEITYQFLDDVIRELAEHDAMRLTSTSAATRQGQHRKRTTRNSSSVFRKLSFHMASRPLAGERLVGQNFCRAQLHSNGSAQRIRKRKNRAPRSSFPLPTKHILI